MSSRGVDEERKQTEERCEVGEVEHPSTALGLGLIASLVRTLVGQMICDRILPDLQHSFRLMCPLRGDCSPEKPTKPGARKRELET